jgi:DNA helicase HerA-like ATPase
MLNTPSAKSLTDYLIAVIRLQRHHGVRVVIATQEPTLLTDLIALCSVTVIHRFSSPQWLTAIKKHIPISDPDILQQIEDLERGTALVYAPHAVLGRDEDGGLVKGIGRLLRLDVRKRVTADGGQSILAV